MNNSSNHVASGATPLEVLAGVESELKEARARLLQIREEVFSGCSESGSPEGETTDLTETTDSTVMTEDFESARKAELESGNDTVLNADSDTVGMTSERSPLAEISRLANQTRVAQETGAAADNREDPLASLRHLLGDTERGGSHER